MRERAGRSLIPLAIAVVLVALPAAVGHTPSTQGSGPTLTLRATPSYGEVPLLVSFNLTVPSGPQPNLSWSFGDGSFLNGSGPAYLDPSHTYVNVGRFLAAVNATWTSGSDNTSVRIVTIASNLTAIISAAPNRGYAPLTVHFEGSAAGGAPPYAAYSWTFGDGGNGTGASVNYTYAVAGVYSTRLEVTDSGQRTANSTESITVLSTNLSCTINATPANGSAPLLVHFVALPTGGSFTYVGYAWRFGDGGNSSGPLANHEYTLPGRYPVTLVVTDSRGANASSSTVIDARGGPFRASVQFGPANGTAPLTVGFQAAATGGSLFYTNYSWTFGDGATGLGWWVNHTFDLPGTYRIALTLSDTLGDLAFANATVTVRADAVPPPVQHPASSAQTPWLVPVEWGAVLAGIAAITGAALWSGWRRLRLRGRISRSAESVSAPSPAPEPVYSRSPSPLALIGAAPAPTAAAGPPEPTIRGPSRFGLGAAAITSSQRSQHTGTEADLPGAAPSRTGQFAAERLLAFRLIRHLATRPRESGHLSDGATQAHLATQLEATRGAVSKVLRRLEAAGIVAHQTGHVAGAGRRLKVYRLTPRGERMGRALDQRTGLWDTTDDEAPPPTGSRSG